MDSAELVLDLHFATSDSKRAFETTGGKLDGATSPLIGVLHVSGNAEGTRVLLDRDTDLSSPVNVRIPLDAAQVVSRPDSSLQAWLPEMRGLGSSSCAKALRLPEQLARRLLAKKMTFFLKYLRKTAVAS